MLPKLLLAMVAMMVSAGHVYAAEATMPVANQKFISLHGQRNLAAKNRTRPNIPPRFFALNAGQKMMPLAKRANPAVERNPVAMPVATKPVAAGDMSKEERAHQLLSLFAAAD